MKKYRELLEVKGRLRERKIIYPKLAKYLDISLSAVSNKLNGKSEFTLTEASRIGELLDIKQEEMGRYFF
ncbi:MAG: DUF739 family protein [Clostridia bacterium]|nr:DUF739 family protein [Clostridia bacterium]